jgi:O-antigen/teichoic acid export membrane protein
VQNAIFGGFSAVRYLGGAALVVFVSPSVLTYSKWLALTGLFEVLAAALATWALLGGWRSFVAGRLKGTILAQHWRFSLVFAAAGAIGTLTASLDRVFLGRMVPASQLGLYGLLYSPAGVLTMMSAALAVAAFPEFAAATSASVQSAARNLFLRTQLLTTVCILAIAIPLTIHFGLLLRIWTRDDTIAQEGLVPGVFLLAALAVNALANPSYTFLVASGRPRIALAWNLFTLPIECASLLWLVPKFGITGAAIAVFFVNMLGLLFYLSKACQILTLKGMLLRAFNGIVLLGGSLYACNLAVAAVCHTDTVRVALSCSISGAIGYIYFKYNGLLKQYLRFPS